MDINRFFTTLLHILNEMSPYVLLGFLIAGFLHEFVKSETMSRHLSGGGWKPIFKAALLGVPLPLCSCGVLPTAVGLYRQGASKGATTAFLISTPQTGVDSIAATYSLLGLPFAILRPIAALIGGIIGGVGVNFVDKSNNSDHLTENSSLLRSKESHIECHSSCCNATSLHKSFVSKILGAIKYGLVDMVASVGKWLVIGLVVAALITIYVPDHFLISLSDRPLLAMLAMIVIAIPMYVCATGSIPIAMSLVVKGLNPGAAFVLLMAGPAANFASMIVLGKTIGKKATAIYVLSVIITALIFGLVVDYTFPAEWLSTLRGNAAVESCCHTFSWFPTSCTVLLILALLYSSVSIKFLSVAKLHNSSDMTTNFKIEGMACNHCRMAVEKAISTVDGVENVVVSLADHMATVEGDYDIAAVVKAITDAGFDVKAQS